MGCTCGHLSILKAVEVFIAVSGNGTDRKLSKYNKLGTKHCLTVSNRRANGVAQSAQRAAQSCSELPGVGGVCGISL